MACIRKRRGKWVVDYRDATGRRRWITCATKRQADKTLATKLQESGQAGAPVVNPRITIADYSERWLTLIERNIKPRTYRSYEETLRLHLLPAFGTTRVQQLVRGRIRAFLAAKLREGLSRNTVRIIHATLRAMLNSAIDDGVIAHNPAERLGRQLRLSTRAADREEEIKAFDREQLDIFLTTAEREEPKYFALFFTLARSGLRLGEAFALEPEDLDYESREIVVRRAFSSGQLDTPKSGRSRRVDMSLKLRDVLQRHETQLKKKKLRRGWKEMPRWVFCTEEGSPMDQSRVSKAFKRVLKAAGLPRHYSPHCLRHTFASLLLQQGESPAYVQRQLGHASIQLTVDTYGRWLPMGNKAAVDRLDRKSGSKTVASTNNDEDGQSVSDSNHWSRREDLNLRPADYESAALPLSYTGSKGRKQVSLARRRRAVKEGTSKGQRGKPGPSPLTGERD
jgi:integrase